MEETMTIMSSAAQTVTGIVTSLGDAVVSLISNAGIKEVAGIGLAVFIVGSALAAIPFLKRKRR